MTTSPSPLDRRARVPGTGRYLTTVLVLTAAVVVTGLSLVAAYWTQLPVVAASHWGPTGVDDTQGRVAYVVTATVLTVALGLLLGATGLLLPPDGRRMMATVSGGITGFLGTVVYGALLGQRGVVDPSAATLSPWLFVAGVGLGAVLGVIAWAVNPVLPRPVSSDPVPADIPRIPASDGERIVWFGWAAGGRWVLWVSLALVVLGWFVAVVASPWAALGPAFGIVLLVLVAHARVVVDATGLQVTSAGVLRWLRVPIAEVAYADRSELHAFQEFGGLGLRFKTDERAFVTRTGEALRIVQRDGTRTYVSMDDSGEAAAVLNTLVERRTGG